MLPHWSSIPTGAWPREHAPPASLRLMCFRLKRFARPSAALLAPLRENRKTSLRASRTRPHAFCVKNSLPFDVEHAALSYHVSAGNGMLKVVAALSPQGIVQEYEAAFRDSG